MKIAAWAGALVALAHALPAAAQYATRPSFTVEAASDERRRGLSWSNGDPVVRGTASVPVAEGLSLEGSAVSLWGSDRHGGADAVIDLGSNFTRQIGGWRLTAKGRYHLFPGASHQGYGEIGAIAGFSIGPANLDLSARYAPRQSAIGGDNLYLVAGAAVALPGTPFTLSGHLGRSSGDVRDPFSAARLRPDGTYWDHDLSIDWYQGRWFAGVRYANSSIDGPGACHAGATIITRAGLSF